MSLELLLALQTVANLDELRKIGNPSDIASATTTEEKARLARGSKDFRLVLSANGYSNLVYAYRPDLDFLEALPAFVKPSDNQGTWIMSNNPFILATAIPQNAPDMAGVRYYASLSSPDRTLEYFALSLSDPVAVADWQVIRSAIDINGAPTFAPDYQGQRVRDLNTGIEYIANGTAANSSSWVPTEIIKGANITADKTIGLGDRNRWFEFSNGHTLTLPAGLTRRVYFELVGSPQTATLTLAAASGATLVGDPAVTGSARIRNDGSTWYKF